MGSNGDANKPERVQHEPKQQRETQHDLTPTGPGARPQPLHREEAKRHQSNVSKHLASHENFHHCLKHYWLLIFLFISYVCFLGLSLLVLSLTSILHFPRPLLLPPSLPLSIFFTKISHSNMRFLVNGESQPVCHTAGVPDFIYLLGFFYTYMLVCVCGGTVSLIPFLWQTWTCCSASACVSAELQL